MPILGLTDRGASFPRIGELRKGGEKPQVGNKPGPDLKHFRFTSQHQEATEIFRAAYGNTPTAINCYLPFQTSDDNFEAWIEEWGAGSLKWRGNGQRLVIWQKSDGTYSQEPKPQPEGGKQVGRLKVIVPELGRLAYVVALTTSIHDIAEMSATLAAYEALRGDLRGIPFILSRVPRMVSTPKIFQKGHPQQYQPTGERVRMEKWLWHLEAQPVWVQAQLSVMQRAALPAVVEGQYQLSAGAIDVQTGEIMDDDEYDDTDVITNEKQKAPASEQAQHQQKLEPTTGESGERVEKPAPTKAMMNKLHALGVQKFGPEWDDARHELVDTITNGRTNSSKALDYAEVVRLAELIKTFSDYVDQMVEPIDANDKDQLSEYA